MSLEIWFQGCSLNCKNCQNPNLRDVTRGFDCDTNFILDHLSKFSGFYQSVIFLGGEPCQQPKALSTLLSNITLTKILYTGLLYEDLPEEIKNNCDIIIDGPYVEEQKTDGFPSSSNQRIWNNNILTNIDFRR
jgi:anaerobic ribonucleoside-triphosphate reductase activating protein